MSSVKIAPVHGINDIKFMKGCYGKLSNFNLPSNAQLSGYMLVIIAGQGTLMMLHLQ